MTRISPPRAALLLHEHGAVTVGVDIIRAYRKYHICPSQVQRVARRARGNLDMSSIGHQRKYPPILVKLIMEVLASSLLPRLPAFRRPRSLNDYYYVPTHL